MRTITFNDIKKMADYFDNVGVPKLKREIWVSRSTFNEIMRGNKSLYSRGQRYQKSRKKTGVKRNINLAAKRPNVNGLDILIDP